MADSQLQEDPLKHYTGLSLFPRTLSSLSLPDAPTDPLSLHNFLKSLPVRNPDKLIKAAESILDSTAELPNPRMTNNVAVLHDVGEVVNYPRGQRPGLDRKRRRFSLIHDKREPVVNLEPALDFDKLKDPEEFFLACERRENAKKEIAKQTGGSYTDSDQYNVFNVPLSQRPGIQGRSRTSKYKHLYPTMSSQENSGVDTVSNSGSHQMAYTAAQQMQPDNVALEEMEPTDDVSQQTESANDASEDIEPASSVDKVENQVSKLLDDFLASEELDDGALNLLQGTLQFKPYHIEQLNLPELPDFQRTDFKASGVNLSKSRNVLSDINNLLKETRSKTPVKLKSVDSSVHIVGSPTPPRNPYASLSALQRKYFKSNPSNDPFSADYIDQILEKNASHVQNIDKYSDPVDAGKTLCESGDFNSQLNEENDGAVCNMGLPKVTISDFTSVFKEDVNVNLTSPGSSGEIETLESDSVLNSNNFSICNEVINEKLCQAGVRIDIQTKGASELEKMVEEDALPEAVPVQSDQGTDVFSVEASNTMQNKIGISQSNLTADETPAADECPEIQNDAAKRAEESGFEQDNVEDVLQEAVQPDWETTEIPVEASNSMPNKLGQSNPPANDKQAAVECPEMQNGALERVEETALEQHNEGNQESSVLPMNEQSKAKLHSGRKRKRKNQEPSVMPMNGQSKAKLHSYREHKRKASARRQSLADCGMSWDNGLRRSTRIKSRPLEFWKGERFLYGRIHGSLATVIGIKYASPGKDNGELKVKSFVSDEYKNLVEDAGLY
ncbi:centromere protein C isoform X2 [Mercurialis annua]|uniref:centromere protein C isoform X2 n=1 Tax=Mercurialis annua TaxID=3986 RepID=UPI002160A423|nr:centromere protein C isoform X2 [Mercurialis annua]